MLRIITAGSVLLGLLALSGPVMAQGLPTGNIRGLVKDESGAILPGATVTITSPALIGGPKTAATNNRGVYRFPSLAVGIYAVEASMDGFDTFRMENVQVGINVTMSVNFTLKLAEFAETVTVTGESPVLDITEPGYSTNWKSEMVEELPTNRNFWDYAQMSPGIAAYSADGQGSAIYAFGSGAQANSWNVDGIPTTSNDTGASWWWVNPDMIEEVEVLGVGGSAEFGNAMGATVNIVTKSGGNEFHGGANFFFQSDALTDTNVVRNDIPFHRERYRDITAQLGGPISTDKIWFFGAFQHQRDAFTQPAIEPEFFAENAYDRFDFKLTAQISEANKLHFLLHQEYWECCQSNSPFIAPSATGSESGSNPAWRVGLTSIFSDSTLLELKYAGWWGDDIYRSVTGSTEEPFIDYSPPGGGPTTYSGGLYYPWDYIQWTHQASAKMTKYAEDFLNSQHEFKFGVQWGYGTMDSAIKLGENGTYVYNYIYEYDYYGTIYEYQYLYRVYQKPYVYGGTSTNLSGFVHDSVTIGERLTLNLDVRFDHHNGDLRETEFLTPDFEPTGESSPGAKGLINWNNLSPRFGFAFEPVKDGGAVIRGTAGIYYAQNVMGNWDGQIVEPAPFEYFALDPVTGESTPCNCPFFFSESVLNFDLKNARAEQYSIGYEQQLSTDVSVGVEYVHKEQRDLIGWDIVGGAYEQVPYTDPFTGNQFLLLNELETPVVQKGNGPIISENILALLPEKPRYETEYNGVFVTFNKRYSEGWSLSSSYTWSRSEGLTPNPLSQFQGWPGWTSRTGSNPNNFINARGRLQADRPHMFKLQGIFHLPGDLFLGTSVNIMSGVPFSRQVRLFTLREAGGGVTVIIEPAGSRPELRHSTTKNVDIRLGKRISLGGNAAIRIDGMVLNVLNDDAELDFETLRLDAGEEFQPINWVFPRRLMLRVGFQF